MWRIQEHHDIEKVCRKLPPMVVKKYELWKNLVFRHGPEKLREFPGFHDEKLKGERAGQRSSRLNVQYRVAYTVHKELITVHVLEITPHKY
ncbi:MAG: type II toxin-antitoxin system mRNA interferase toxin, RelE/StbE family [Thermodesulfobacteriota bacterium]